MYNHTYRGVVFLDFDCATLIMIFFIKLCLKQINLKVGNWDQMLQIKDLI